MRDALPPVPVSRHTLSNGLTVLLYEDRSLPLVAVNVNYSVGSKDEKPGRTGFAHLFEHMMFQGSAHYDDDYFKPLQDVGASVNGATNTDRTRYWELLPSGYLERALWLESDRMGFLLDALTQERLDNQIAVVQNERRQNYENRPYGTVWEKLLAVLYPPTHPYSWPTIGSMDDIRSATLDEVQAFFRAHYTPGNASLCIAGDFDRAEALDLVSRYFGGIPAGPPTSRLARWIPHLADEIALDLEDRVQIPRSTIVWPTVPVYSPGDAALDALAHVLGGGKSSRLYKRLVYDLQIAQDATLVHASAQLSGVLHLTLTPRPGHTLAEVEEAAHAVIAEALDTGVTTAELDRTRTTTAAGFTRSLQNIGGFGGISDRINEYVHYLGVPDRFSWDLERTLSLTTDAVLAAARRIVWRGRVVARVNPLRSAPAAAAPTPLALDRSVMPQQGKQSPLALPLRQRFRLANGLDVVLVEKPPLPLVHCVLVIRGGASAEPANRPGLASLAAAVAQEGAGRRTALEIADDLEALGAEFTLTVDADAMIAGLSAMRAQVRDALAIVTDVLARPSFLPDELERRRARRLVQLTQLADQPTYLAQRALLGAIHGDHPYGRPVLGTHASVAAIGLDEIRGYWEGVAVPANATLVVVGNIRLTELEEALAGTLATWSGEAAPSQPVPSVEARTRRTLALVDRPDAPQSLVAIGDLAPPRNTADYAALVALNAVLGGQFVSRLNLNLREEKGVTYGVRSSLDLGRGAGTFSVTAPVQTSATATAAGEILAEIAAMRTARPVTPAELAYATGTLVNGYARRFETAPQVARALAEQVLYGLPDDDIERFPRQVAALATDDVARAAGELLRPERLAVVVVGDSRAVAEGLRGLGLGPAEDPGSP